MTDFTIDDCHDVQWFEKNRPEIFNFVKNIDQDADFQSKPFHHIILVAPVKSGKREIMEAFLRRNNSGSGRKIKHIYLSALNRKDDKPQLEELRAYGFSVYLSSSGQQLVDEVAEGDNEYDKFIIHFNESDYGTGSKQLMGRFFKKLIENPKVQIIAYSATNEEATHSRFARRYKCKIKTFIPPTIYCGTKWYLDNKRVIEAEPFWDEKTGTLSRQGIECCDRLLNSDKIFGVVRFPTSMKPMRDSGKFEAAIKKQYGFKVKFVDANDSFDWGNGDNASWYGPVINKRKTILAICQTATRSTELKFHRHISFWHGAQRRAAYNTIIQADCRPIFYDTPENGPVDIVIYSSVKAFRLNAEYTKTDEYDGKLAGRMSKKAVDAGTITKLQIEWLDHKPTLSEFNTFAKKNGAFSGYTETFNRTVSGTDYIDIGAGILKDQPVLMGRVSNGVRSACTVYFDKMNSNYLDSWKIAQNKGVVAKYAIALEFDEVVTEHVVHLTTKRSVFEVA